MLSYAFKILNEGCYKSVSTESFENASDLFAAILIKGVSSLLSRGLSRSYIGVQDSILSVKGKINLSATIKENALIKREVVCEYDDFSPNEYQNKILKYILSREIIEFSGIYTFKGELVSYDSRIEE